MKLDHKDRLALRQIGVWALSAILAAVALTCLIVLLALWVRIFLAVV